jgi:hypothetical protein
MQGRPKNKNTSLVPFNVQGQPKYSRTLTGKKIKIKILKYFLGEALICFQIFAFCGGSWDLIPTKSEG